MSDEQEGIIKFNLEFTHAQTGEWPGISELNAWRAILFRLGLTGCNPDRYQGLAYGNVSVNLGSLGFLISGTGTGQKHWLRREDYCRVLDFDLEQNRLRAEGPIPPSSEALTHGAIYSANPEIQCVIHVHAPEIWRHACEMGIIRTDDSIAYGTPAMGRAIEGASRNLRMGVIAMGGHEDGVIAFGATVQQTALETLKSLANALQLEDAARPDHDSR